MLKILQSVASEKLGYGFGKPLRVDEKAMSVVLPILRVTSLNRQYITFPETEQVHVFDTGKIDQMEADNQTDQNVFVRSGTLFTGATQERALQRSVVLFPHQKQIMHVRCVHRGRGIGGGTKVKYGGTVPLDVDKGNYGPGYTPKDQGTYWSSVANNTMKMSNAMGKPKAAQGILRRRGDAGIIINDIYAASASNAPQPVAASAFFNQEPGSDDLCSNFKDFAKHFDSILSRVKLVKDQAGLALINQNGVETIEFFDHSMSWKALHECAVKRLGSNIIDPGEDSVFEYKPENAVKAVTKVLGMDYKTNNIFTHRPSNGEPEVVITGLTANRYVGEAVEINGALVHLVILKTE